MKNVAKAVALILFATGMGIFAQTPTPKEEYKPSEVQSLRLQVKIKDAQLVQNEAAQAQQKLQTAVAAVNQEVESIKTENKWPAGVTYNFQSLTFVAPPPPPSPVKPATPTPADKK